LKKDSLSTFKYDEAGIDRKTPIGSARSRRKGVTTPNAPGE